MADSAKGQCVYVKNTYLPFEEDETHEFKGHRNIAIEDLPEWVHHMTPDYRQSRKSVSRNLNGFLNTGSGGTVYLGVDDTGRVLGLHLTRFQKDHVLLAVRDTLRRYRPPVSSERYTVTFVPVVAAEGVPPLQEYKYNRGERRKRHRVATAVYCWCEAECKARAHQGQIPMDYVVEIAVLPWSDDTRLHPFHLTESGSCYIRRSASLVPLTALDVVQLTRHQAAALSRRHEAALLQQLKKMLAMSRQAGAPDAGGGLCRCGDNQPGKPSVQDSDGGVGTSCSLLKEPSTGDADSGVGSSSSLLDAVPSMESRKGEEHPVVLERAVEKPVVSLESAELGRAGLVCAASAESRDCDRRREADTSATDWQYRQAGTSGSVDVTGSVEEDGHSGEYAGASGAELLSADGPVVDISTAGAAEENYDTLADTATTVGNGISTDTAVDPGRDTVTDRDTGCDTVVSSAACRDTAVDTDPATDTDTGRDTAADDSGIGTDIIADAGISPVVSTKTPADRGGAFAVDAIPRDRHPPPADPEAITDARLGPSGRCGDGGRLLLRRPFLDFSSCWQAAGLLCPEEPQPPPEASACDSDCGSEDSWSADYRPAAGRCPS